MPDSVSVPAVYACDVAAALRAYVITWPTGHRVGQIGRRSCDEAEYVVLFDKMCERGLKI